MPAKAIVQVEALPRHQPLSGAWPPPTGMVDVSPETGVGQASVGAGHGRLSGQGPAAAWPQGVPTRGVPLVYPPSMDAPRAVGSGRALVGAGHARESVRSG